MEQAEYIKAIEKLMGQQKEDQKIYTNSLATMMAQLSIMMQTLENREQEFVQLCEQIANRQAGGARSNEGTTVCQAPLTEIAVQIPKFDFHEENLMSIDSWIRRVENS